MSLTQPVAVISDARSGSRETVAKYIELTGNPYGGVHYTYHVPSECLTLEQLKEKDYTLHGHWYSLHKIDPEVVKYIDQNYEVVTIERDHLHRFLSCALVIHTKDIDFHVEGQIEIPLSIVDNYLSISSTGPGNKSLLTIDTTLDFDEFFGEGESLSGYQKNYASVSNAEELINYYLEQYEIHGPC